jgi:protein tyrosine phosphatase
MALYVKIVIMRLLIILVEFNRVQLQGSNYFNASHIEFGDKKAIATQNPMPHTREEFWQMILEYEIPTVIVMTSDECSYLPAEGQQVSHHSSRLINQISQCFFRMGTSIQSVRLQESLLLTCLLGFSVLKATLAKKINA